MVTLSEKTFARVTTALRNVGGRAAASRAAHFDDRVSVFRPRLSENVRLVGRMSESAFAVEPWLVERDGKFIQVTELLYRLAELADGSRSIEQIADDASSATGSDISPELVAKLIESRLAPIGLIAADPHLPASLSARAQGSRAQSSPLALNMRMAVISPRLISALTRWLQYLYLPAVLIALLLVTLQAQFWLFFVHGVGSGVYATLDQPLVVPLVIGLVIASAGFHELGHAAALRYGRGEVRGMGVGFYLMYPAFYTDVTDNYRLGRWARVRTDLGGFFFNLLFSLGLMAVYHVTGAEYLLLVVLLTDLDIAHQCLPFVRLDGYWALADLTGIPDFFSLFGAYLRSVFPMLGGKGRKLPQLKWWAKAVFGLYLLITIPALAALLFLTVRNAPHVIAAALAMAQQKLADVVQAQSAGDGWAIASAEAQMVLLLLPAFGIALMLLSLARGLMLGLWRWGRPTRGRRSVSVLLAAAAAAMTLFIWMPGLAAPLATFVQTFESSSLARGETAAAAPDLTGAGRRQEVAAADPAIPPTAPGGGPDATPAATAEVPDSTPAATAEVVAQSTLAATSSPAVQRTPDSTPRTDVRPTRAVSAASEPTAARAGAGSASEPVATVGRTSATQRSSDRGTATVDTGPAEASAPLARADSAAKPVPAQSSSGSAPSTSASEAGQSPSISAPSNVASQTGQSSVSPPSNVASQTEQSPGVSPPPNVASQTEQSPGISPPSNMASQTEQSPGVRAPSNTGSAAGQSRPASSARAAATAAPARGVAATQAPATTPASGPAPPTSTPGLAVAPTQASQAAGTAAPSASPAASPVSSPATANGG